VLGLRRTWKTINFDDPRTYHLAYGDRAMTPGTNLTFFEHPGAPPARPGQRSLSERALRVVSVADLDWWTIGSPRTGCPSRAGSSASGEPPCGSPTPRG
jgi:glyoxalase family protein